MITELLLIAAAGIYDPMDMSGHTMYPSGSKECDKYPKYALPASKLAKLTLPVNIISNDGRIIKAGHYLASLSISKQTILIFDGEREIFELNIDKSEIMDKKMKISTAKFYQDDNSLAYIILIQGALKIFSNVSINY